MNNQPDNRQSDSDEQQTESNNDAAGEVNIQPSEPETGSDAHNEENAPGRTPGKAEGSSEIVEADLEDGKN